MGNATKLSYQSHISLVQDLKPGEAKNIFSCDHVQHSLGFTVLITVVFGSGILWMAVTSGSREEGGDLIFARSHGAVLL